MYINKKIFFLLISFNALFSFGQVAKSKYIKSSVDIMYGQRFLSHKTFDGAFNDLNNINFGTPLAYVGFGATSRIFVSRGGFDHDGAAYYTQIVPQPLKVNDSISAKITGFNFGFSLAGTDLFTDQKNFDVIFGCGINTGRLRMFDNSYVNQKNPYFAPKLSLLTRIIIGRICLQVNAEYDFDVSKKNWRRTNFSDSPKINLSQTSLTGLTILTSIGIVPKQRK